MSKVIAATLVVVAGLVAANMLGVAAAEAPTTPPVRTVSVQGVATVPIAQGADLAAAKTAYREGMAAAMADGQGKAEFLASKAGGTLGAVQSIAEGGGSISCTGGQASDEEESSYVPYGGESPDFGWARSVSSAPLERSAASPAIHPRTGKHPKAKKKSGGKPAAKKATATAVTCTLSTELSLAYAID